MTPRPRALFVASLSLLMALAGCLSDEPKQEEETPAPAPPVVQNLTHNVTAHTGEIRYQARGPTGTVLSSTFYDYANPILTTTNYTGMVAKLTWEASNAATETLTLICRPDSDAETLTVSGPSPLRLAIDMTANTTRSWFVEVSTDTDSGPVAASSSQPFTVTIGQYAGQNGTFDPDWDPQA